LLQLRYPSSQVRSQYRKIFTAMGFQEMPTNNYVESSFWNFDSLFQPQQHPARDAHDTFFLTSPASSDTFPEDYLQRVKVCIDTVICVGWLLQYCLCNLWCESGLRAFVAQQNQAHSHLGYLALVGELQCAHLYILHGTFLLTSPASSDTLPEDYLQRVKVRELQR
jgi:phenylalanyl-tRNA synthetase alpha subunit